MMRHSHPSQSYPASQYDDHLCLKPPVLLWVAVLYFSRAITLPIAMAMGHFAGVNERAIDIFRGFWSADALIPSTIAVVMLYALCRRVPTASKAVRWIWSHGRIVLAVAAILDMILLLVGLIRHGEINDQSMWSVFALGADLYFVAYILAARRVRHAFAEFPPPLDTPVPAA
jgi:Protein of unknown function (DUF2919)